MKDSPRFVSPDEASTGAPVALAGLLDAVISDLGIGQKLAECRAKLAWERAVGSHLARQAQPINIRKGRMEVAVSSPVWSSQLSFMKGEILKKINLEAGAEVVTDLVFVTGRPRRPSGSSSGSGRQSPRKTS